MPRFEINFLDDHTDESLLNEVRRIAAGYSGCNLTVTEFSKLSSRVSIWTLRRRFGAWGYVLEKAGLAHMYAAPKRYTDESLLNEVRRTAAGYSGCNFTVAEFSRSSPKVSEWTLRRRFGAWGNVLEKAGLAHMCAAPKHYTDEQCFENLANVWTNLGRCPKFRELREPPSVISPDTYERRWGTLRKGLKAFVDWANSEEQPVAESEAPIADQSGPAAVKIARKPEDCREVRPGLRFKVFMRDRFRCLACGRSPATHLNIELHADYVLAVANGGKTTLENLQTLCQDCNLGKGRTILT